MKAELPKHFEYQLEVSPFVLTLYYLRFLKIYQLAFTGIPWILIFLLEMFSFGLSLYSAKILIYYYNILCFVSVFLFLIQTGVLFRWALILYGTETDPMEENSHIQAFPPKAPATEVSPNGSTTNETLKVIPGQFQSFLETYCIRNNQPEEN